MSTRSTEDIRRAASSDTSADDRTLCEQMSDHDNHDGRPSGELSEGDYDLLESEDERERLLTEGDGRSGLFGNKRSGVKIGRREKKPEVQQRKSGNEESSALMYEMEEGIGTSRTSLRSKRSSENDEKRLLAARSQRQVAKAPVRREQADTCIVTQTAIMPTHMYLRSYCHTVCSPSGCCISPLDA